MNEIKHLLMLIALSISICPAFGYEQATHALITHRAVAASGIADPVTEASRALGLNGFVPLGKGIDYFELVESLGGLSGFMSR